VCATTCLCAQAACSSSAHGAQAAQCWQAAFTGTTLTERPSFKGFARSTDCLSGTDLCPGRAAAQYAFFLNTNPTLLVDKTGIIPVSGNSN